ncbi:adenine deaminase C-terminal domain-containing protein [Alteribacillus bidgolensis]|uniref:Adenine deaminase n=1 Tax=Alteribacillus bidgolensis TaxID=930129 RepID=A0A1G8H5A2_9BACI|nr:adenine deaminase C-terminal domain-containing protein [Alteribacillus bidgolensis]SDI01793.1 adenine deaminase [Alteribacillus bidgolensis]
MKVDLLILNVQIFQSSVKKFISGNAAIKEGRFFYIGDLGQESFEAKEVIQGQNRYMIPGLIDIHLHIESTMVTPSTFSFGLIKNGVTSIVADSHEMANVFGMEGVTAMMNASDSCAADIFHAIPSSVPSTAFETTGGEINIEEIDALRKKKNVVCLGEVMDYTDLLRNSGGKTQQILNHLRHRDPHFIIEGHCPIKSDLDLNYFIFSGIDSDHTHQTVEGMEKRIKLGMFIEIQEKSMNQDIINHLIKHDRSEHFCFVTDDVMADTFLEKGHLNHIIKKAIHMGMSKEAAIYAATATPAKRMQFTDRGSIAPNKIADFILLNDLPAFDIDQVYKSGKKAFDKYETYDQQTKTSMFPNSFYQSVQLSERQEEDFTIKAPLDSGFQDCRIMTISDGSTFTKESSAQIKIEAGELQWEASCYGLVAVFERYGKNGNKALGLIGGDTIKKGAIATTYAHDNHNLLTVGQNKTDLCIAANKVIENQGGICVVEDEEVKAFLHLPLGGVITEAPLAEVAEKTNELRKAMKHLGYKHYNPIMSISTHSLPVSPELKITDLGLIRVNEGQIVPLFL